jgi:hypothetical protein
MYDLISVTHESFFMLGRKYFISRLFALLDYSYTTKFETDLLHFKRTGNIQVEESKLSSTRPSLVCQVQADKQRG